MPDRASKSVAYRRKMHFGPPRFGYALAVFLIASGSIARFALLPAARDLAPFLFFYPCAAIAAFVAGIGPGLTVVAGAASLGAFAFPVSPSLFNWITLPVLGWIVVFGFASLRNLRDRAAAVAAESARLRFVVERVSDWIFMVDESGRILYVNQTACDQLGFASDDLLNQAIEKLDADPERGAINGMVAKSREGAASPHEIAIRRGDGSAVIAEVSCTAIRDGGSMVVHVAARDITVRRQLDQKLREALQWESLRALTGGLAHDFNNLLTAMLGNTSLARAMLAPEDPVVALLGAAEDAGERSAHLIRMMLATAGYQHRSATRLRIDRMANEAASAGAWPPGVHVKVSAESCEFESDPQAMETLLRGLITNAAESYGTGSGEVTVNVQSGGVPQFGEASFAEGEPRSGSYLGIVVEDHGCGMTREVAERAFNPFFTTKFTGRGLGLPAVRGIVRAHDGILWMRTEPGAGTRVEVWLPAARYHQSAQSSATV